MHLVCSALLHVRQLSQVVSSRMGVSLYICTQIFGQIRQTRLNSAIRDNESSSR